MAGTDELCVLMDRGFAKDPGDPETHWHRDDEAVGIPALHGGRALKDVLGVTKGERKRMVTDLLRL